jgi:hypothetical protein
MKLTGSWTKYGGGRGSIIKAKINKTWYCQSCGQERPKEMSPFLYSIDRDYIRVCATCLNDGVIVLQRKRIQIEVKGYDKNKPM